MVELRRHRHGGGRRAHRAGGGGHRRPILVVVAQRVIDHGLPGGDVGRQPGRVPARLVGGGGVGGCGGGEGGRALEAAGHHRAGGGGRPESGRRHGLLLVVVVGGGGGRRHVRVHPGGGRRGGRAAAGVLGRGTARRTGRAVVDYRRQAGFDGGGTGRTLEQLLMVELLVVLWQHAIDDEFGTHCCRATSLSPHRRALFTIVRMCDYHRTRLRFTTGHFRAISTTSFNPIAEYFLRVLLLYFFESFMTHVCSVYSPLCLIHGTRA